MFKKIIKYTSRIVLGLVTLFWGFITWGASIPPMAEYPCEAGQEEMSLLTCILIAVALLIAFCFVWYKTRKW